MRKKFDYILRIVVNVLDRRVSISQLAKTEDLVLSNASLDELKMGINKVYAQVNTYNNRN